MSERWLIIVNGKTERNYITGLRQLFRSSNVQVEHVDKDPLGQVLYAEKIISREKGKFARVYVVFDTDNFEYEGAISRVHELNSHTCKAKKASCKWQVIVSRPCFELWILLHSNYTNAEFAGTTPCKDLRARFPEVFAHYSKVDQKSTKELVDRKLHFAELNGRKLDADPASSKTDMWRLVDALRSKLP